MALDLKSLIRKIFFARALATGEPPDSAWNIIHDLSNPLTALSMAIEELREEASINRSVRLRKHIETAVRASRKMRSFILSARMQAKKHGTEELFDVSKEILGAIRLFRSLSKKSRVRIRYRSPRAVFVSGDPTKFFRAVSNVISNAIESYAHEPPGGRRLVLVTIETEKGSVCVSVRDFGCGIPKNLQKRVFEPFFSTKQKSRESMGLGLSIVKKIIEEDFGGSVKVKSALGKGSTFKICIPR